MKLFIRVLIIIFFYSFLYAEKENFIGEYELIYNKDRKNNQYTFKKKESRPRLILSKDNKFKMSVNYCEGIYYIDGNYEIKANTLILRAKRTLFPERIEQIKQDDEHSKLVFVIISKNELEFDDDCIGCFTCKGDIFVKK